MSSQRNRPRYATRATEPVVYSVLVMIGFGAVCVALNKIGLPEHYLTWGTFLVVVALTLWTANTEWPARVTGFTTAGRSVSAPNAATVQLMAISPAGLLAAYLSASEFRGVDLSLAIAIVGLAIGFSAIVIGVRLNRSGAYNIPDFLSGRFQSRLIGLLVAAAAAVPLFLMLCGQSIAFGMAVGPELGFSTRTGTFLCIALAFLLVCLSGMEGILRVSASCCAIMLVSGMSVYLFPIVIPIGVEAGSQPQAIQMLSSIASAAIPLFGENLPTDSELSVVVAYLICVAVGLALTPVFMLSAPAMRSGFSVGRAGLASLVLIGTFAALLSGLGEVEMTRPETGIGGNQLFAMFPVIAIASTIPVTSAILLFGLSGLISHILLGIAARQTVPENARLLSQRLVIAILSIGAGWSISEWGFVMLDFAAPAVFVTLAAVLPVSIAGMWWRRCGSLAALTGIVAGAAAAIALLAAKQGYLDPSFMVSGPNPVFEFLMSRPAWQAGAIGVLLGFVTIFAFSFVPHRPNEKSTAFVEGIQSDDGTPLLNQYAL
ncbi:MAG: hypothetical protein AB3N20_09995 [Rhizobiaceae bacterium]